MDSINDSEGEALLVMRAQSGDIAAFEQLISCRKSRLRSSGRSHRHAHCICSSEEQLAESLAALEISLSPAELMRMEEAIPASAVAGERYAPPQMRMLDSER